MYSEPDVMAGWMLASPRDSGQIFCAPRKIVLIVNLLKTNFTGNCWSLLQSSSKWHLYINEKHYVKRTEEILNNADLLVLLLLLLLLLLCNFSGSDRRKLFFWRSNSDGHSKLWLGNENM